jgi:hypothetical protein
MVADVVARGRAKYPRMMARVHRVDARRELPDIEPYYYTNVSPPETIPSSVIAKIEKAGRPNTDYIYTQVRNQRPYATPRLQSLYENWVYTGRGIGRSSAGRISRTAMGSGARRRPSIGRTSWRQQSRLKTTWRLKCNEVYVAGSLRSRYDRAWLADAECDQVTINTNEATSAGGQRRRLLFYAPPEYPRARPSEDIG